MTLFRYTGRDESGTDFEGELDANSVEAARGILAERGVKVIEIGTVQLQSDKSPMSNLTSTEQAVVDGQVRNLIAGGLPLAEGLRAAADEFVEPGLLAKLSPIGWIKSLLFRTNDRRIRRALLQIASEVEAGTSVEDALARRSAPNEIKAVLRSGIASKSAAMAIGEYSGYAELSSRARGQILFLFAYPLVSVVAAFAIVAIFFCMLVPAAKTSFEDFGTEIPALTQLIFEVSDALNSIGIVGIIAAPMILTVCLIAFFSLGGSLANRVAHKIPLVGAGFRYLDLARVGHVLAVVLRHNASVPGALRAAGAVAGSTQTAAACDEMAKSVESGGELPESHAVLEGLPLSFLHVAKDDSDRNTIADGLHSLATMFEHRARSIMAMLSGIVQPLVVLVIAVTVAISFYALFLPFMNLLNDLA
ncbi:MAG: type II secretion system F family protein [Planctomycetaceae bacterium]